MTYFYICTQSTPEATLTCCQLINWGSCLFQCMWKSILNSSQNNKNLPVEKGKLKGLLQRDIFNLWGTFRGQTLGILKKQGSTHMHIWIQTPLNLHTHAHTHTLTHAHLQASVPYWCWWVSWSSRPHQGSPDWKACTCEGHSGGDSPAGSSHPRNSHTHTHHSRKSLWGGLWGWE